MKTFREYYIEGNKDFFACHYCMQSRNDALGKHSACAAAPALLVALIKIYNKAFYNWNEYSVHFNLVLH